MKKLMVAVAVAGAMAFGALADINVDVGIFKDNNDFAPLEGNVLSGTMPESYPVRVTEGALTPDVLTDGAVGVEAAKSYCVGNSNSGTYTYVYSLGDSPYGYELTAVNLFGGWGGGGWRGHIHLKSIQYCTAAIPDQWVTIPGTTGKQANPSGSLVDYVKVCATEGDIIASGVIKFRFNIGVCNNGYHALNEVEAAATPSPAPEYFETTGYTVLSKTTGSDAFVNSTVVGLANLPTVAGANEMACDTVVDKTRFPVLTWLAEAPAEQTLAEPAADDADLVGYMWYRNSDDDAYVPRLSSSQPIRYTKTNPVLSVQDSIEMTMFEGDSVTVSFGNFDTGTTGGESAGEGLETKDIPILGHTLTVKSGPSEDADEDPATVKLTKGGDYVLTYAVMNAAGNSSTTDIALKLNEVPLGVITWSGAADNDWNNPANWTPSVVPRPDDEIVVLANATVFLPAGVYPATGTLKSLTIGEGSVLTCGGDTTTSPGSGVTINAKTMSVAGTISADGRGYAATKGPGYTGRGTSHGGAINVKTYALPPMNGSRIDNDNYPNAYYIYGDYREPVALGSGGAAGAGAGGGAVKIVVEGTLTLDGAVTANGAGGGTGGSIWIAAGTLEGAGTIAANGSASGNYGSSGGRVAIYHETSTFTGSVSVKGDHSKSCWGLSGTLYEPNRYPVGTAAAPADVTVDTEFDYIFPENDVMHYWNLTVAPGVRAGFSGGKLSLGDLSLSGSGTALIFGKWYTKGGPSMEALELDSITLADTATLLLPDSVNIPRYDLDSLVIPSGTTLYVGRGDWSVTGGRGTEIFVKSDVSIAGTLSAQGRGFTEGQGVGTGASYGPGHGGTGVGDSSAPGYGEPTRPTSLGTGAFSAGGEMYIGGGAVKLVVDGTLEVNGTIIADGGYTAASAQSCASGGSVWLQVKKLTGEGKIQAQSTSGRRYGAGGRIAIESVETEFTGIVKDGVIGSQGDNRCRPGTIFQNAVMDAAVFGWADGAVSLASSYTKPTVTSAIFTPSSTTQNSMVFDRTMTTWKGTSYSWTEACYLKETKAAVANTATYVLDNLTPNAKAQITVNGVTTSQRVDADGKLTFTADIADGGTDVEVRFSNGLMLIVK